MSGNKNRTYTAHRVELAAHVRTQAGTLEVGLTPEEVSVGVVSVGMVVSVPVSEGRPVSVGMVVSVPVGMVVGSWAQTEAARIATRANFLANIIVEAGGGKKR